MKSIHAYEVLKNPVWHSLESIHKHMCVSSEGFSRYPSPVLKLMGSEKPASAELAQITEWFQQSEHIYMVGLLPRLPAAWRLKADIECLQMVYTGTTLKLSPGETIIDLDSSDAPEMLELVNLVQPGFFYRDTYLLGSYAGIRKNGKLVAMAGERMKLTGFTEISAVSTHPDFTGRGYARMLTAYIANKNLRHDVIPFLHVRSTNQRAIKVYESLGFNEVRKINFCQLVYLGDRNDLQLI